MMVAKQVQKEDHDIWHLFIAQEPSFALLQSWEWGEFKRDGLGSLKGVN